MVLFAVSYLNKNCFKPLREIPSSGNSAFVESISLFAGVIAMDFGVSINKDSFGVFGVWLRGELTSTSLLLIMICFE